MSMSISGFLETMAQYPSLILTTILTLAVILVNGWTDAPNAIATCVSTRAMRPRAAIIMAAIFNFLGVLVMTLINKKVAETIYNMAVSYTHLDVYKRQGKQCVVLFTEGTDGAQAQSPVAVFPVGYGKAVLAKNDRAGAGIGNFQHQPRTVYTAASDLPLCFWQCAAGMDGVFQRVGKHGGQRR